MTNSTATSTTTNPCDTLSVGVDIGGTNAKLGVVLADGNIQTRHTIPTGPTSNPHDVCREIAGFVTRHTNGESVSGVRVGVAVPGILDDREGVLREVSNLPQWAGFGLRDELAGLVGSPVVVVNDANAAAFGEHSQRCLERESLALVTLGTGIGCGVVLGGQPFVGDSGCGGELGHVTIDYGPDARLCGCGRRGHLESYAGATGVIATARALIEEIPASRRRPWMDVKSLTPECIATHAEADAEAGDDLCWAVVHRTARWLGAGISILCQTLNPSFVLLGGAMTFGGETSRTGRRFLQLVKDTVREHSLEQVSETVVIEFAVLGNDAGLLGAAELARNGL